MNKLITLLLKYDGRSHVLALLYLGCSGFLLLLLIQLVR